MSYFLCRIVPFRYTKLWNVTWVFGAIVFGVAAMSCTPLIVRIKVLPGAIGLVSSATVD